MRFDLSVVQKREKEEIAMASPTKAGSHDKLLIAEETSVAMIIEVWLFFLLGVGEREGGGVVVKLFVVFCLSCLFVVSTHPPLFLFLSSRSRDCVCVCVCMYMRVCVCVCCRPF